MLPAARGPCPGRRLGRWAWQGGRHCRPLRLPLTSTRTGSAPLAAAPHTITSPRTPARPAEGERPNRLRRLAGVREAAPPTGGGGQLGLRWPGAGRDIGTAEVIGKTNRIVNSSKNNLPGGRDPQGAPLGTGTWTGAPLRAELGSGAVSPVEPDAASLACQVPPQNGPTRGPMGVAHPEGSRATPTLTVLCQARSRVPLSQPYLCVAAV